MAFGILECASMVDTGGPVEIGSSRGDWGEDRKVDLILREMRRYNVKVTAGDQVVLE